MSPVRNRDERGLKFARAMSTFQLCIWTKEDGNRNYWELKKITMRLSRVPVSSQLTIALGDRVTQYDSISSIVYGAR